MRFGFVVAVAVKSELVELVCALVVTALLLQPLDHELQATFNSAHLLTGYVWPKQTKMLPRSANTRNKHICSPT